MKKVLLIACVNLISLTYTKAQTCSSTLSNGQNLVTNGDFSQGYAGWTHDAGYTNYTYCSNCYSTPGNIYAHDNANDFNHAFTNNPDHSPSADGMMLMVDGVCTNGINLWSQSNIPITSNTFYYFSVWISSLTGSPKTLGSLNFNINGFDLATNITAPATVGPWIKFTATWNSGATPPPTATISIQNTNTTGCSDGVDFAIDDISFSPGCDFGSPGPVPNLGPDFSICGKTLPFNINPNFDAATAASGNITYTWFKDNVQVSSGPGIYNFSVNAPGTYAVCTDSMGTCKKTDILVISNTYSIDLGPDQALCNPIVAALDARYTGPGVTYQWSAGGAAISGATNQTYTVNTPGTYSVFVHDPSCGDKSDTVGITTLAAVANNGTYCRTSGTGKASLSVTGTGKYKWWTTPNTSGTVLATGPNYTTPVLSGPGSYTYYVQDTSTFSVTAGPPATGNGFSPDPGYGVTPYDKNASDPFNNNSKLVFNALTTFRIDSITVIPYNYSCNPGQIDSVNFIVFDSSGAIVGRSKSGHPCISGHTTPVKVPVGINIPQGNGYILMLDKNNSPTQGIAFSLNTTGSGGNPPSPELYHYPTTYSNAVTFVSNNTKNFNLYYSPDAYPGYYDWKITKGVNCQFVPVYATEVCPSCVSIVAPTSINSSVTSFCKGSVSTIDITAVGGSGDSLVLYKGSCGGTRIAANATGAAFTGITAPTTTTTYFARWESTPNCKSACVSVTVTPVDPPSTSNPGTNQTICNVTSATLNAKRPLIGIGAWSVVSGTGSITNTADSLSTVTGIGAGDLILKWKITNNPCPADSNNVTIHRNVSTVPDSIGKITPYCNDGTTSTINLTVYGGMGDSLKLYEGSCGGTRIGANATGAPFTSIPAPTTSTTYFARWESAGGTCNSTCVSLTVTPVELPQNVNAVTPLNICDVSTTNLQALTPTIGKGTWSVVSGAGTITNPNDPLSGVKGLAVGDLKLTWTVSNSPCPDTTVNVTIHRDTLTPPVIAGSSFDTCASLTGVVYSTTVNQPASTYIWTTPGAGTTLNVTSQVNNTATVDIGTAGGILKVTETLGACALSDSAMITIAANIVQPVILDSVQVQCDSTAILAAIAPLVGTGYWTVKSGSAFIVDPNDPQSAVTGLGNGINILTWTVTGCGGPLSFDVKFKISASDIVLHAMGPTDTTCAGKARDMSVAVTGGSGGFLYDWTSSDHSFSTTTKNTNIAVSAGAGVTTYYVIATDTVNLGCTSNVDSVKIHAVADQVLTNNNLLTPNRDGLNERLIVTDLNTHQAILPGSSLEVYNRWGERVFKSESYDNNWDAEGLNDGIYYYSIKAGCGGGKFNGWIQVVGSTVK
jgi:hypothetical protein